MMHYLDNGATTRVLKRAADAAYHAMREEYGNPSSFYRLGLAAEKQVEDARRSCARAVGCDPAELFFTGGGTEAINTAILGIAEKMKGKKKHIVSTAIEHHAVLNTLKRLGTTGFEITLVQPERCGHIPAERILSAVREDTGFVSMMAVNNETGAILPVSEVKKGLKAMKSTAVLHTDAVQALFKLDTAPAKLGADIAAVSGHKIGAPKGIGALYIRKGLKLPPLITGGGQESGMRAGTEPVPLIAAFAAACDERMEKADENLAHMASLRSYLCERIQHDLREAAIISPEDGAPHVLCISLPGTRSEVLIRVLGDEGICVSGGAACSKGKKSHVFTAMKLAPAVIEGALRISFCPESERCDIDALMVSLDKAKKMFL